MDGLGERIKANRKRLGLSMEELANQIGTTKQTIYKYEKGIVENIPLGRVEQLADVFKISPSELAGWK